jgi:phenylpropionate dioxygenase-like ring-hydroxylating dioxygenase large terminal subunit
MPDIGATDDLLSTLRGAQVTGGAAFAADVARILAPSWQFVCHESDLPAPGTAMRFDFCGRSALVVRQPDAGIGGFVNACRHRGSRLIDGDKTTGLAYCIDGRIRCPAHGWVYDSAGALAHAPRESFYPPLDRSALALERLAVSRVGGWVFVAFAAGEQLPTAAGGEWLARCEPGRLLPLRRLAEPRIVSAACNWRIVCADGLDLPLLGSQASALPIDPASLRATVAEYGVSTTAQLHRVSTAWSAGGYLRQLATLTVESSARWECVFVWPNAWFEVTADQWTITQVLPLDPGRAQLREISYGLPDMSRRMRVARYLNRRLRRSHIAARVKRLERLQAGLTSADVGSGPLAGDEIGLAWFTRRLRDESSPD